MLEVGADQALAFRVAGHHLDRRVSASVAVAAIGLQEYPPGWGALAALRARSLDELPRDVVQVNSFRGVPYVVPRADARIFTAALVPEDEAGLKSLVGTAPAKEAGAEGYGVGEALSLVAAAARDGLAAGPLDRVERLESPPRAAGVRLLGGHDPYVAQPDRGTLVGGDGALRKKLFPAMGRPGVVLVDGRLTGLWRGRRKGDVLDVEVDWLADPVDIAQEASVIAALRDCGDARVL